ncbi:MAG: hypothetical protein HDQ98_07205 [Lachnospiraceae bacterium]|nr:hypothetical protein [Lachnospiraceae bacterium]
MKEKVYQSMYRQIHLSDRQKHRIWADVKEEAARPSEKRKARLSLRGAVCVCAVLVASGITVLAANSSYVERIAEALHPGKEATQEEMELYTAYGNEVDCTFETAAGTVRLEAALYDDGSVCIPFTLYPDTELIPGMDLMEDYVSRQTLSDLLREIHCGGKVPETAGTTNCFFRIKGRQREDFSYFTRLDSIVQEDGSIKGSYVLQYAWTVQGFAQGDVIQYVKEFWPADGSPWGRLLEEDAANAIKDVSADGEPWGRLLEEGESTEGLKIIEVEINGETVKYVDLSQEDEVLIEIPLEGAPLPKIEISTAGVELPYGLTTDNITITPLALYMHGMGDANQAGTKISYNLFVVLKDGTVAERADSGGGFSWGSRDENDDEYEYSFTFTFDETIDLDEVAGVRITELGEEILYIPVE